MNPVHLAFVSDLPLVFTYVYDGDLPEEYSGFEIVNENIISIEKVIKKLEKKEAQGIVFMSENVDQSWKKFLSNYTLIEAAGGLVRNNKDEYLFIHRYGKWDLPKGKAEYDETPEITAVREVEEECGISGLKIEKTLDKTFHTYKDKGKFYIKKTHWFLMDYSGNTKPVPQAEEGITEVKWMSKTDIQRKVVANTYASIREILK